MNKYNPDSPTTPAKEILNSRTLSPSEKRRVSVRVLVENRLGMISGDDTEREKALKLKNNLRVLAISDPESFKNKIRELLQDPVTIETLKRNGIRYLGQGKWDLTWILDNEKLRSVRIGPNAFESFPNSTWNLENGVGAKGRLKGVEDFNDMLISIGYSEADIKLPIKPWKTDIATEDYKAIARRHLEDSSSLESLRLIGIHFNTVDSSWEINPFDIMTARSTRIAGKYLYSFPCMKWIKKYNLSSIGNGITNHFQFQKLLFNLGYTSVTIKIQ